MTKGTDLIAQERQRQVDIEGWTAEHDRQHQNKELAQAAAAYILDYAIHLTRTRRWFDWPWPWSEKWWKPTPDDPVRQLVKAGALVAAEIDRLLSQPAACRDG